MKHISVTDTTIRQAGKAAGYTLSFREKIELAKILDRLGVSVIELHAVENPKIDSLLIKSVASAVKESAVCVPVALDPASVSLVWAALREAKHPRIQVPAPVSAVQMEYLAGKKPAAMLEAIRQTVAAARAVCEDVEFLADDATRADPAFLAEALQTTADELIEHVLIVREDEYRLPEPVFVEVRLDQRAHTHLLPEIPDLARLNLL